MTASKLTVTEALVKLKMTSKKIADAQARLHYGIVATKGSGIVAPGFKNNDDYKKEIKARLDSVKGLIQYRDALKRAIITSNATTKVQIGSRNMTVAEAIDFKQSIGVKKSLYDELAKNLKTLNDNVTRANASIDNRADAYVIEMFKGNSQASEEEKQKCRANWMEANRAYAVTDEGLKATVESLGEEIQEFVANADVALSVINAKTEIEV